MAAATEIVEELDNESPDEYEPEVDGVQPKMMERSISICDREGPLIVDLRTTRQEATDLGPGESTESIYNKPLSPEEAMRMLPGGGDGITWHAQLVTDAYLTDPSSSKHVAAGQIKGRRPMPTVLASDFFGSCVQTPDGRWVFHGVLNGWPGLQCFELRSITGKNTSYVGRTTVTRYWDAEANRTASPSASYPADKIVRVNLRAAPWTARGWTESSPGYAWWFFHHGSPPAIHFGEDMIKSLYEELAKNDGPMPQATKVHLFAHRYARGEKAETTKDKQTYHEGVIIEWSHGNHCTLVELATLNGVGGRQGKCNWQDDKETERPQLYRLTPALLVAPWLGHFAEIRCYDIKAKNEKEFKAHLDAYTGPSKRFLAPEIVASNQVRLSHAGQDDIMRYILNYIRRDRVYSETFRHCQAFAADFYGFLSGKKDILPYHALLRANYKNRSHLFLYNPDMYAPPPEKY